MNEIAKLSELAPAETQAVIINCGTKWVSTLALLSADRNTGCPVLLINCESRDGSREHFFQLSAKLKLRVTWMEWPLRPHHAALDQLFREVRSERVLLVDSDVELLSHRVFAGMSTLLSADASTYGSGFLHGPEWVGSAHGLHENAGYYMPRMWIPLTLLRTDAVRTALNSGLSFEGQRLFQDLTRFPRIARLLGYRYRFPHLQQIRLPTRWRRDRSDSDGEAGTASASFLDFDTGAVLHRWLLAKGYRFAALPRERWTDVRHFHGGTRTAVLNPLVRLAGQLGVAVTDHRSERSILEVVKGRLSSEYGL